MALITYLTRIQFDFGEFADEDLIVSDVEAKDLDEFPTPSRARKSMGTRTLLDRLLFREVRGAQWFFISEWGQVVLNIHTGGETNLRVREAKILLPQAVDLARLFTTREIVVVHGYRRGTAWKETVHSFFGIHRCRALGGHQGITLVTLP